MPAIWKLEPCFSPTDSHAADLLEIRDGEVVRRVSLPRLDVSLYAAYINLTEDKRQGANLMESLIVQTGHDYKTIESALRRLSAIGILSESLMQHRGLN